MYLQFENALYVSSGQLKDKLAIKFLNSNFF